MSELENINKTDIQWIKNSLERIEKQTIKTNGRVNELESWRNRATGYILGASAVFSLVVGFAMRALGI